MKRGVYILFIVFAVHFSNGMELFDATSREIPADEMLSDTMILENKDKKIDELEKKIGQLQNLIQDQNKKMRDFAKRYAFLVLTVRQKFKFSKKEKEPESKESDNEPKAEAETT